ncbi:Aspartyl protease family protein, partial [Dichanthelium oligosanthes]
LPFSVSNTSSPSASEPCRKISGSSSTPAATSPGSSACPAPTATPRRIPCSTRRTPPRTPPSRVTRPSAISVAPKKTAADRARSARTTCRMAINTRLRVTCQGHYYSVAAGAAGRRSRVLVQRGHHWHKLQGNDGRRSARPRQGRLIHPLADTADQRRRRRRLLLVPPSARQLHWVPHLRRRSTVVEPGVHASENRQPSAELCLRGRPRRHLRQRRGRPDTRVGVLRGDHHRLRHGDHPHAVRRVLPAARRVQASHGQLQDAAGGGPWCHSWIRATA